MRNTLQYILKKLLFMIPMVLFITFLIYLGLYLTPGDAISYMFSPDQLANIDPAKLELIKMAAAQTSGKSGKDLAPILLALITNANKKGIRFTSDEVSLIFEILKEGKSKEEQAQIDKTIQMTRAIFQKHTK